MGDIRTHYVPGNASGPANRVTISRSKCGFSSDQAWVIAGGKVIQKLYKGKSILYESILLNRTCGHRRPAMKAAVAVLKALDEEAPTLLA